MVGCSWFDISQLLGPPEEWRNLRWSRAIGLLFSNKQTNYNHTGKLSVVHECAGCRLSADHCCYDILHFWEFVYWGAVWSRGHAWRSWGYCWPIFWTMNFTFEKVWQTTCITHELSQFIVWWLIHNNQYRSWRPVGGGESLGPANAQVKSTKVAEMPSVCAEELYSGLALERHMRHWHPLVKPFWCLMCPGVFNNSRDLSSHVANVHHQCKVVCKHCAYKAVSKARMKLHICIHICGICCDRCKKSFPN